jgi:hypothetical protein
LFYAGLLSQHPAAHAMLLTATGTVS